MGIAIRDSDLLFDTWDHQQTDGPMRPIRCQRPRITSTDRPAETIVLCPRTDH
jgi:hypothetical protein